RPARYRSGGSSVRAGLRASRSLHWARRFIRWWQPPTSSCARAGSTACASPTGAPTAACGWSSACRTDSSSPTSARSGVGSGCRRGRTTVTASSSWHSSPRSRVLRCSRRSPRCGSGGPCAAGRSAGGGRSRRGSSASAHSPSSAMATRSGSRGASRSASSQVRYGCCADMGPLGEGFLMSVAQAVWLAIPVILGGAVHIAVIKLDLLRSLARVPLDGGLCFRGRRLLGDNKTVRGAVTMIGATATFVALQAILGTRAGWARPLSLVDFDRVHPLLWGVVLGGGHIPGELPNSFIKRQLGVAPGDRPAGVLAPLFWLTDELDGLAGA